MLIDCDDCALRDLACGECVVTALLRSEGPTHQVEDAERLALDVLADNGLVPRLRLVPLGPPGHAPGRRLPPAAAG